MIVVYYGGALGNKMFEYANAYTIKQEYPEHKVCFFDTLRNVVWYDAPELDNIFKLSMKIDEISNFDFYKITGQIAPPNVFKIIPCNKRKLTNNWYKLDAIINKNSEKRKRGKIIRRGFHFLEFPQFEVDKDYFLQGHFGNTKYFEKYQGEICKEFQFKNSLCIPEADEIKATNSVSVHVRRGDHVLISATDKYTYNCNLCNEDYYLKAIQIIEKKLENPIYYFFSDDIKYVKEKYGFIRNLKIICSGKDYMDMQLMSMCKHNIIANSTFGYWAAFLNKNSEKIVIAPKYYEYRNGKPIDFVYPNEWIKIEV